MMGVGQVDFEYIVVGAGCTGAATAYELGKAGAQTLLLEQYDFLHDSGSSHGESRVIRRTYVQPEYARMMPRAYQGWAELERVTGRKLYYQTGGLDFAKRGDPALARLVESCEREGIKVEKLSAAQIRERFPLFTIPDDHEGKEEERAASGVLVQAGCGEVVVVTVAEVVPPSGWEGQSTVITTLRGNVHILVGFGNGAWVSDVQLVGFCRCPVGYAAAAQLAGAMPSTGDGLAWSRRTHGLLVLDVNVSSMDARERPCPPTWGSTAMLRPGSSVSVVAAPFGSFSPRFFADQISHTIVAQRMNSNASLDAAASTAVETSMYDMDGHGTPGTCALLLLDMVPYAGSAGGAVYDSLGLLVGILLPLLSDAAHQETVALALSIEVVAKDLLPVLASMQQRRHASLAVVPARSSMGRKSDPVAFIPAARAPLASASASASPAAAAAASRSARLAPGGLRMWGRPAAGACAMMRTVAARALRHVVLVRVGAGWASGIMMHDSGLVLTNAHVVAPHGGTNAVGVEVRTADFHWHRARVLALCETRQPDVALLRILSGRNMPAVDICDTAPTVGARVLMVGHSLFGARAEIQALVTQGTLAKCVPARSATTDRTETAATGAAGCMDFLLTTAGLWTGGSGGLLVDAEHGHMLGMAVANLQLDTNPRMPHLNFCLPISTLLPLFGDPAAATNDDAARAAFADMASRWHRAGRHALHFVPSEPFTPLHPTPLAAAASKL